MKNLVYINGNGHLSKAAFEVVTYAKKLGGNVTVLATGKMDSSLLSSLGAYGATEVLINRGITGNDDQQIAAWIASKASDVSNIIFSHDFQGKAIAPRLSVRLKAGLIAGAVSEITEEMGATTVRVLSVKKPEGAIPLPEAEMVVSAGRGLKGPEHWGMIESLANSLGAATACSRPVADIGWRPHHEHVGQTGVAIRPNLYIAVGISGAIQHLAGVNGSKVIVVVNTDAEAPFFKAADYGVVGDAFEVIPKLTEAIHKFKAAQ